MGTHSEKLWNLSGEIFSDATLEALRRVVNASPFEYDSLVAFDCTLAGPNMRILSSNGKGCYAAEDREIFRPLQYCAMFLNAQDSIREWTTRETVHMAGLHLESLIKRAGQLWKIPLGTALGKPIIRSKLSPESWQQLKTFSQVYNIAKHDVDQPKDTHKFSLQDAVLAYCISRELAVPLYSLVHLHTSLASLNLGDFS